MIKKYQSFVILLLIILLGAFFRFNNLNWDHNHHLHPDERFLTMVGNAMTLPLSVADYFNQQISTVNPVNIGYKFFVYGNFPIFLNKLLAGVLNMDNYNDFTILGRHLSAYVDLLVIILVYKITILGQVLFKNKNKALPVLSAYIYAVMVLPIQLSHFFAVDTFLNFFMFGSLYFILRTKVRGLNKSLYWYVLNIVLGGIFLGLALASKITAIYILPLLLLLIITKDSLYKDSPYKDCPYIGLSLFLVVVYVTVRLANPYYFQNSSFFDPTISQEFLNSIKSLQAMTIKSIDNWFPPMVQWLNKNSLIHSLINNSIFGMGLPISIFVVIGIIYLIFNFYFLILKKYIKFKTKNKLLSDKFKYLDLLFILIWLVSLLTYQSFQATPTLRYFIIFYPYMAILAAIGIIQILNYGQKVLIKKEFQLMLHVTCYGLCLMWPLMFSSIYIAKNSRVEASEWIYKNLSDKSYILSEYWDDGLPLMVENTYGKQFKGEQLPVFDPDTTDKWEKFGKAFDKADYYILSSNRGWGSILTAPEKYPIMSRFYQDLLNNKNKQYKLVKEFYSYPSINLPFLNFNFSINDDWADEGFTVYDHPKVLIFKKYD